MKGKRIVPLEAVHNFRDYGDYPVTGGGRLRSGMLYRSAQHAGASGGDLETISSLALATAIDFRGSGERMRHPCPRAPGFTTDIVTYDGETAGMPPHLQAELAGMDGAGVRRATAAIYRDLPMRVGLLEMLRRYFQALASRDGPSLVHCVAGKDRTGIAVALFHTVMGVHDDDILEDYLLTNTAGDPEARIAAAAVSVRKRYGAMNDEALRAIMGVAPEYLENAFDAIAKTYGSRDRFLEIRLGVDAPLRENLRRRYVLS